MEKQGHYHQALQSLIDLIYTLPEDLYKKFKDKIELIQKSIAFLRLKVRAEAIDWFNRINLERKVLEKYSRRELTSLIREVCKELDQRGYMEKTAPDVDEGYSHTLQRR